MGRRWSAGVGLMAVALSPGGAAAADSTGQRSVREVLVVEPGATCIEPALLAEHVASWLDTGRVDGNVTVEVRGSPDRPRTVSFRTLRDGHVVANRVFDPGPERCDHLHAVLGLAIAMALEASLVDEVAPAPIAKPIAALAPPAPSEPAEPLRPWTAGADIAGALGVLPDAAGGLGLRVERALGPPFRVRFGLLGILARNERFAGGAPGGFYAWLLAPRLDGCAGFGLGHRVRIEGCVGALLGVVHAAGAGFPASRSASLAWLAVANGLGAEVDMGARWALHVEATLFLPLARSSIVARDFDGRPLYEDPLPAFGAVVGAGPTVRF